MESRHSLLQSDTWQSSLVGARTYEVPLLPWERQLIRAIGCTEDEYKYFRFEALKRSGLRPAGYEHIPYIENKVIATWVVQLIVGLTLTAVSVMLAPKPPKPEKVTRRELGSTNQAGRFTPTHGFDSAAELATYGQPLPIVFGEAKYDDQGGHVAGGMLVSPLLVWSRMFSLGHGQAVKQLFIVSEQGHESASDRMGLIAPDLGGIFIGNGALDALYEKEFAFYWKPNTRGNYRIRRGLDGTTNNLLYGTVAEEPAQRFASGDVDNVDHDDVFDCPVAANGELESSFCEARSLSNNTDFGAYSPISSGTEYKPNWRVISIPDNEDPGQILRFERVKIAGSLDASGLEYYNGADNEMDYHAHFWGMGGSGRCYSRRMGIVKLTKSNGTEITASESEKFKIYGAGSGEGINEDDEITFLITSGTAKVDPDIYANGKVKVEDINGTVDELREKADDSLKIGTIWQIGRTWWQVTNRSIERWQSGIDETQTITLKCIDNDPLPNTAEKVGIVNEKIILLRGVSTARGTSAFYHGNYIGDILTEQLHTDVTPGPNFFPLMQSSFALVRNTRACNVTEIGIKSRVFAQLNGLFNFPAVPTAADLHQFDDDKISLTGGSISSYIHRYSFFYIKLRPAGSKPNSSELYEWDQIDLPFGIYGSNPIDQYNSIQIFHDEKRAMEYKFVPKTGAEVHHNSEEKPFLILDATAPIYTLGSNNAGETFTSYGTFTVKARGLWTRRKDFIGTIQTEHNGDTNREFVSASGSIPEQYNRQKPNSVSANIFPASAAGDYSDVFGRRHALTEEIFDNANAYNTGLIEHKGEKKEEFLTAVDPNNSTTKKIRIKLTSWAFRMKRADCSVSTDGANCDGTDNPFWANRAAVGASFERWHSWYPPEIEVDYDSSDTTGNWAVGDVAELSFNLPAYNNVGTENPFARWMVDAGHTKVGYRFTVTSIQQVSGGTRRRSAARCFEEATHYADISAYEGVVTRSNESGPEHHITYVNEIVENPAETALYAGLTISGIAVKARRNFSSIDQIRLWLDKGIPVQHLHPLDSNSIGASNLLTDLFYYLLTNRTAGLGRILNIGIDEASPKLVDKDQLIATSKFLRLNELFYNGAIAGSINLREYMSEVAPHFLCNFIISDGRFSLKPALPVTDSGAIDTGRVNIKQLFTGGNIIEGSFEATYLTAEQKKSFKCLVKYRQERENQFPSEKTIGVSIADTSNTSHPQGHTARVLPEETYDLTQYCTTKNHALKVAKYLLSLRHRVTHTISFKTTPYGVSLGPSDLIRVVTEFQPYSAANNGVVTTDGTLVSVNSLSTDTDHTVLYYRPGEDNPVTEGILRVNSGTGKVANSDIFGCVFTILDNSSTQQNVYRVEQLTIGEDNMVEVIASEFPCNSSLSSLIAKDVSGETTGLYTIDPD